MKAITLWQPWASLIADRRKTIETRPRPWKHTGLVAIHAGLKVDREACVRFGYDPDTIPRGCIVAVALKGACVRFPHLSAPADPYGDFTPGRYGYILHAVWRLTKAIPASGMQGFWEWHTDGLPSLCPTCWVDHLPPGAYDAVPVRIPGRGGLSLLTMPDSNQPHK